MDRRRFWWKALWSVVRTKDERLSSCGGFPMLVPFQNTDLSSISSCVSIKITMYASYNNLVEFFCTIVYSSCNPSIVETVIEVSGGGPSIFLRCRCTRAYIVVGTSQVRPPVAYFTRFVKKIMFTAKIDISVGCKKSFLVFLNYLP